jgi:hypothetical protein
MIATSHTDLRGPCIVIPYFYITIPIIPAILIDHTPTAKQEKKRQKQLD